MRAASPLLQRLRDETLDVHVAIERSVRFLAPTATRDDYQRYLARLYGFHRPLEAVLGVVCAPAALLAIDERRKLPWLRQDLRALGLDAPTIDALPDCASLPPLDGLDDALGCLYVVEGATLGGRYVQQRLRERFGGQLDDATTFLRGHGAQTGGRWRDFGVGLTALAGDPERIVAAARGTFVALHRWLARDGAPLDPRPLDEASGR